MIQENKIYSYDNEIAHSPHILKILRYVEFGNYFECEVIKPKGYSSCVRIDPFVSGDLSTEWNEQNIIGQTIEVDYVHGFVFLAEGVKIKDGKG